MYRQRVVVKISYTTAETAFKIVYRHLHFSIQIRLKSFRIYLDY